MRLSCNLIVSGGLGKPSKFYTAGEPVPDELVPKHALEYRISEQEGAKLFREIMEWQALVAERREKARREEAEKRKRQKQKAGKA